MQPAARRPNDIDRRWCPSHALAKGPGRFLDGGFGRDAAWLFVPSLVALGGILAARRRAPRTDPWRAGALLWGIWLILTWSFISSSHFLNGYYLAALAPALAALCGLGFALAWKLRDRTSGRAVIVMATVAVGVTHAVSLVPGSAGVRGLGSSRRAPSPRRGRWAAWCWSLRPGWRPRERRCGTRPGRAGAPARRRVGVGDRGGRRPGTLRLALPAGGSHSGGTAQLVPRHRALAIHRRRRGAHPHHAERRDVRHLGPGETTRSWPPVASSCRWAASPARCRARRCPYSSRTCAIGASSPSSFP